MRIHPKRISALVAEVDVRAHSLGEGQVKIIPLGYFKGREQSKQM